MGDDMLKTSTSRTVKFDTELTSEEYTILCDAKMICQGASEDLIIRTMRKCINQIADRDKFTEELINRIMDSGQEMVDIPTYGPQPKPENTNVGTDAMECSSLGILEYINPQHSKVPDREDCDLQRALQESMLVSNANSNFEDSLPVDVLSMIRDPNISTGLFNGGNTCWFNCVCQVLYHIPMFRSLIYHVLPCNWRCSESNKITPENVQKKDLLIQMRVLMAQMQFSSTSYIDTTSVLEVVDSLSRNSFNDPVYIGHQQDATEGLIRIFEWLETSLKAAFDERLHRKVRDDIKSCFPINSTSQPPNSDLYGTAPPSYDDSLCIQGTSAIKRTCESRQNSPVRKVDIRYQMKQNFNENTTKKEVVIEEPMDQSTLQTDIITDENDFEMSSEERDSVLKMEAQFNDMFASTVYTKKLSNETGAVLSEKEEMRNCPQFFHLQISYGELHDALEAQTFDTSFGNSTHDQNLFGKLPAVMFVGLSRFNFTNTAEKLHDKFTFPKVLYMDRYLKKNSARVLEIRKKQALLREQLSKARSIYRGLMEYPHGYSNTRLVDAYQTVLNSLQRVHVHQPPEQTIAPSFQNCRSQFVEDLGKTFPNICPMEHGNIPTCVEALTGVMQDLEKSEIEARNLGQQLELDVKNIYDVDELQKHEYQLHSVIIHSGEATRGHYWTYSRVRRTCSEEEQWEKLNDQQVEIVPYSQVENDAFGNNDPNCPSAYCLVYIRTDANWLTDPDKLTREEALFCLPEDLRGIIEKDEQVFTRRCSNFRESSSLITSNGHITNHQNKAIPCWGPQFEATTSGDENQNINVGKGTISLLCRLDSGCFSVGMEEEKLLVVQKSLEKLTSSINLITKSSGEDEQTTENIQLGRIMETDGLDYLGILLGYSAKELRSDAENDADRVYDDFICGFYLFVNSKSSDFRRNCITVVKHLVPDLSDNILRFFILQCLSRASIPLLTAKATQELENFERRQLSVFTFMKNFLTWFCQIYEVMSYCAASCQKSLECVLEDESSSDFYHLNCFHALRWARLARCCEALFRTEVHAIGALENVDFMNRASIQLCVIVPMTELFIIFIQNLATSDADMSKMTILDPKNNNRISSGEIFRELQWTLLGFQAHIKYIQNVDMGMVNSSSSAHSKEFVATSKKLGEVMDNARSCILSKNNTQKTNYFTELHNAMLFTGDVVEQIPDDICAKHDGLENGLKNAEITLSKLMSNNLISVRFNHLMELLDLMILGFQQEKQ